MFTLNLIVFLDACYYYNASMSYVKSGVIVFFLRAIKPW
jgi:hypothetical protein